MELSFKINFLYKSQFKNIYEFNKDIIDIVKNNTKEIIEKNKIEDPITEKSYRRKIKKKIIENQN